LDPQLLSVLESLAEALTRGDPESPLLWTCKSTRKLAEELSRQGHGVCDRTAASLLYQEGYGLQANHGCPVRHRFQGFLNARVGLRAKAGEPAVLLFHQHHAVLAAHGFIRRQERFVRLLDLLVVQHEIVGLPGRKPPATTSDPGFGEPAQKPSAQSTTTNRQAIPTQPSLALPGTTRLLSTAIVPGEPFYFQPAWFNRWA
jgi:hypothetical protein